MAKRMTNRLIRIPIALAALSTTLLALPGTANAASIQWYSISGTTSSQSWQWTTSATYRTKQYGGRVLLDFATRVRDSHSVEDAIKWRFIGNQGEILGGNTYTINTNAEFDAEYIGPGAQFRNSYARGFSCQVSGCSNSFSGREYY